MRIQRSDSTKLGAHQSLRTCRAVQLAGVLTVVGSVISVFVGRRSERRKAFEDQIRTANAQVYEEFVTGLLAILQQTVKGNSDPQRTEEFFQSMTPRLINWADDPVMVAWSRFRRLDPSQPHENVFALEDLLKAIRQGFGHKNKNIGQGDLLALFINDIDDYLPTRAR